MMFSDRESVNKFLPRPFNRILIDHEITFSVNSTLNSHELLAVSKVSKQQP